jgi:hypothetical protein
LRRSTLTVLGMLLAMTASCAWTVPGTDAFAFSWGLSSGMFAKSPGRLVPGTWSHGPAKDAARNQRPEINT